jgi:hypothetical protein
MEPSILDKSCGKLMHGGMAEWSIAAVLKTAGLTAPGVRIPFPPLKMALKPFYLMKSMLYIFLEHTLHKGPRVNSYVDSVRQLREVS